MYSRHYSNVQGYSRETGQRSSSLGERESLYLDKGRKKEETNNEIISDSDK